MVARELTTSRTTPDNKLPLPSLPDTRQAFLALPGIDYYFPDGTTGLGIEAIDAQLETVTDDLLMQLDGANATSFLPHYFAWSQEEAEEFFSSPARRPFAGHLELATDPLEKREQLTAVGSYLVQRYNDTLKNPGEAGETPAKERLCAFYTFSVDNLFADRGNALSDRFNGVDPESRTNGNPRPTHAFLELIRTTIGDEGKYEQFLTTTEGANAAVFQRFLENYRGDPSLRHNIEQVLAAQAERIDLAIATLQLTWDVENYRRAIGLSFDDVLALNGFSDSQTIMTKLAGFLADPQMNEEMLIHLQRETPSLFEDGTKPLSEWDILTARAEKKGLPDDPGNKKVFASKMAETTLLLRERIPFLLLASDISPLYLTTRYGANPRGLNYTYPNAHGETTSVSGINPRIDTRRLTMTTGEEMAHGLHATLLARIGKDYGTVPGHLKEELAELVRGQISLLFQNDTEEIAEEQNFLFEDLLDAVQMKQLTFKAVNQIAIRQDMEQMTQEGKMHLSSEDALKLLNQAESRVTALTQLGLPITYPSVRAHTLLDPLQPLDPLVYMPRFVAGLTSKSPSPSDKTGSMEDDVTIEEAFVKRFGNEWIAEREARTVFADTLIQSGSTPDEPTLSQFVGEVSVRDAATRLYELGISEESI
ncbi:MAG: hypothetical protein Q8Q49_05215 [bacterium]|nr:hypothetical protein [bacterium]